MRAWKFFLQDLEKKIGVSTIDKWLRCLKIIKFDACNLYLEAENYFQAQWFQEHILPILKNGFYNENFHKIKVHLTIKNTKEKPKTINENKFELGSDNLDQNFLFSYFLASEKNLMTLKLLKEMCIKDSAFNPVFIYGPKGCGKTHLLQALAHKFREKQLNVFYVSAQTFTNHVVQSIRKGNMQEFRQTYRNLDVLIIDDIQILSKKYATQEELFHTFNTLHSSNKKIIISSNGAANTLNEIEARLISRFEWGISLQIEKLEKKEIRIVFNNESKLLNLHFDSESEKYILENFTNIISIKKALETISIKSHIENREPNLDNVKKYLTDLIIKENQISLNPERILAEVSNYFGITTKDILGKSQTKECSLPRQFSMFLCRELLKIPYMKIGAYFKRDHSTVMTSVTTIRNNIESKNPELSNAFFEVTKKLNNFN